MRHLPSRLLLMLVVLAFPALACNLTESPTAVPTLQPPPALSSPVVGLSPVSGPPGTLINVGAAGFPEGAKVNLYLAPIDMTNPSPVAQDLTIGTGGILRFALQLPTQINNVALSGTTPLNFTISTADNVTRASAIFVAVAGGATATVQAASTGSTTGTGGTIGSTTAGTGATSQLIITSPAIGSVITNTVTVTGSGSALNNRVGVQVLDANYTVLGSAIAVIQAAAVNTVGPWQITVNFTPPAGITTGYIVAYTVNAAGGLADQASIPVTLGGATLPTNAPTGIPSAFPTIPAVITVQPLPTAQGGFITATPG